VMMRRIAHTVHHRGQQMPCYGCWGTTCTAAMVPLRILGT
jgi:hypothetical protein